MREVLELASRVSRADASLLITGETGTGKEWLARRIHRTGPRSGGPFVAVNCGAVPEGLFESELFGHVKGAFTGATRDRLGSFQKAAFGTLLLDEIGDIPPASQSKLLRALQDKVIQPVGSDRTVQVDVRIIAATNRDLRGAVERGQFRSDLFYRLSVVSLAVPPLRERRDEIPGLVLRQIEDVGRELENSPLRISSEALARLQSYDWPGNVRELLNVVERTVLLCQTPRIEVDDLPVEVLRPVGLAHSNGAYHPQDSDLPFRDARDQVVRQFELRYLTRVLAAHQGRVGEAARAAGMTPRTLYNKMQEHGLRKEVFKSQANEHGEL